MTNERNDLLIIEATMLLEGFANMTMFVYSGKRDVGHSVQNVFFNFLGI